MSFFPPPMEYIKPAHIGGMLSRLRGIAWTIRTVSTRDRRACEVELSAEDRHVYPRLLPLVDAVHEEIPAGLSTRESEHFMKLTGKVLGASWTSR